MNGSGDPVFSDDEPGPSTPANDHGEQHDPSPAPALHGDPSSSPPAPVHEPSPAPLHQPSPAPLHQPSPPPQRDPSPVEQHDSSSPTPQPAPSTPVPPPTPSPQPAASSQAPWLPPSPAPSPATFPAPRSPLLQRTRSQRNITRFGGAEVRRRGTPRVGSKKDSDEGPSTSFASSRSTLPGSSKESKGKEKWSGKESSSSSDSDSSSSGSSSGSSDDQGRTRRRRRKKKKRSKGGNLKKMWLAEWWSLSDWSGDHDEAMEAVEDAMEDVLEPLSNTPYAGPSYLAMSLVLKGLSFLPTWMTVPIAKVAEFVAEYKRSSILLSIILFSIFLLVVPDKLLLDSDIDGAAKAAKALYCNESLLEDLMFNPLKNGESLGQDLPAMNLGYLKGLANYACQLPRNEFLLVWGPPGSGLHKGLQQVMATWKSQGRVVIRVDLSELQHGRKNLVELIQHSVSEGLQNKKISRRTFKALSQFFKESSSERNESKQTTGETEESFVEVVKHFIVGVMKFIPFVSEKSAKRLMDFYSTKLGSVNFYLQTIVIDKLSVFKDIDFQTFLPAMDILSIYHPTMAPVIVFDQLDSLSFLGGDEGQDFLHKLLDLLHKHKESESIIPIVLLSHDTYWFYHSNHHHVKDLFILYRAAELSESNARTMLVDNLCVWSEEQFQEIYGAVGGHSNSLEEIYKYSKFFDMSIDEAIGRVNDYTYTALSSTLAHYDSTSIQAGSPYTEILRSIQEHYYELELDSPDHITPAMESLIHAGVLYVDSGLRMKPVSASMKNAIQIYLLHLES